MSGVCTSVLDRATASVITQNDDAIGIFRNASTAHVSHLNRESTLGARDATLLPWADPRIAHMSISTIAYDCSFGDITAFNRTFRRHYSASPSDIGFSSGTP
jgi:AraC-like DNA-binding protein